MLDMGGVPHIGTETRINVGKNNKVRAVALDFDLITRSIEERRHRAVAETENHTSHTSTTQAALQAQPDMSIVEQMSSLLGVQLGGTIRGNPPHSARLEREDDVSAIHNGSSKKNNPPHIDHMDVRTKYAAKLRRTIEGGVAGLDLAKAQKAETIKRGDAAMRMAARDLISAAGVAGDPSDASSLSSSRWLTTTGIGKLLSFLTSRSVQIVLLPLPATPSRPRFDQDVEETRQMMESLTRQLPQVQFDLLVPGSREDTAQSILTTVLSHVEAEPLRFLVVSDRDDYMKAARDAGMYTCCVRSKSQSRAAITTNYNVEDAADVLDVVNELNGISFNAALKDV